MNIFRTNNKWLRHRTIARLKENHKEICEPKHKSIVRQFKNFATESNQWWFVFLSVLVIFLISPLVNIGFLNFLEIDHQTAIYIVDQRTTNIAAIVSITLVVVGFILNNLAVKSPLVYGLLFKKSLLYPIIYLTLSVIGIFITISTLRDTLPAFVFTRVVLAGTYFVILILFLIGMLFRKVLLFSNEKEIEKMLDEELMIEAKQNLKKILIHRFSEEIFVSTMNENGAKEFDWSHSWGSSKPAVEVEETKVSKKENTEKLLCDVNIDSLSTFIKKKNSNEDILYKKLSLSSIITDTDNFIWVQNKANTKKEKTKLQSSLVLKSKPKKQKDNNAMRKFYDDKFERLSEQDNHRSMEQILESYLKLYELQMQNQ
jgi:hypothetical protein